MASCRICEKVSELSAIRKEAVLLEDLLSSGNGDSEPAAEKRIADTLHTYARLAVIQHNAVAVIVVAALMHKAAGGSVLLIVHVGAFTVHFPAPFPVPAHGARFCQDCFSRSAIPGRSLSSPGTRCKGCFSPL